MRVGYDSVNPVGCPADGDVYAGYMDGDYAQSLAGMQQRFPGKTYASITVHADGIADIIDSEAGNPTPADAAAWVGLMRKLGRTPTVYCSLAAVPAVLSNCRAQGVALPVQFWVAQWDNNPTFPVAPAGAVFVAKQYRGDVPNNGSAFDQSSVLDFWPGVDDGLDPSGGGTPIGDDMTPAQAQQLQDLHDRLAKTDQMFAAITQSLLPAMADVRPNVDMIPALAAAVADVNTAVANLSLAGVDVDGLSTSLAAALNGSLPAAVVAALASKLGAQA